MKKTLLDYDFPKDLKEILPQLGQQAEILESWTVIENLAESEEKELMETISLSEILSREISNDS